MGDYVNGSIQESATVTLPSGIQPGDLMVVFAFRDGSATNPTIASGWTNITNTTDGTSCSVSAAWRRAGSGEANPTFTNAGLTICQVYRGVEHIAEATSPFGTFQSSAGTSSPSTYAAVSTMKGHTSWLLAFQGHRSINTSTINTAPTSMVNRVAITSATATCGAGFDTNGPYKGTSYASNTVAPGGTASGWITIVLELRMAPLVLNNYHSVRVGDGMGTGERIR